ncbi:Oxidoreductase [Fusarium keratoplasticum]|nr:Oxidoreductase [Fusarium keratoplasticum]
MAGVRVLIIGGGLSGSLLANGLLNNGIDFALYERDSEDTKREGYQIRLGEWAMVGFKACLTQDRLTKIVNKLGQNMGVSQAAPSVHNSRFEEILDFSTVPSYAKTSAINRVVLRNLLLEPVKEKNAVLFDKYLESYEIVTENGRERVKANFADGTSDVGDILVGADGNRSRINAQLGLNNIVLLDKFWGFLSKGKLPYDLMKTLPQKLRRGPIVTFAKGGTLFYAFYLPPKFDANGIQTDASQPITYNEDAASFYWGLNIPTDAIPDPSNVPDKLQLCLDYIKDWAPEYHALLGATRQDKDAADIMVTQLRAAHRPAARWREKSAKSGDIKQGHPRVWLIGDAIHAMQPNRGAGGNTALADTADLLPQLLHLNALAKSRPDNSVTTAEAKTAVDAYESAMLPRAFRWVAKSGGVNIPTFHLDGWFGSLVKIGGKLVIPFLRLYASLFNSKPKQD